WVPLASLTLVLVLSLFVWDAFCLHWLFSRIQPTLGFWPVLQARGYSYLIGAVNYELGQGVLAWRLARILNRSLIASLALCFLLLCHDTFVLLTLGFVGSLLRTDPAMVVLRWFSGGSLVLLIIAAIVVRSILRGRSDTLRHSRWGAWLEGWSA